MEANNIIIIQGDDEKNKGIHYEIDPSRDPIGKGGTGVVRAGQMVDEHTGMRRDVAIKFLYDDMPANILIRSQREAAIRVVSENLVEMIGFVQINEQDSQGRTIVHSHVISELLHGVMLLDILKGIVTDKDGKEVPTAKEYYELMQRDRNQFAIKIVRSVLSGIQALHDNGYIHRDIDPSNIMITDRGKVKLIDLGIAKKIDTMSSPDEQHLTSTGQFIGKAAYAAPELVLGDLANQNETTDIYAIGVMLYLLVVGKLPFNGSLQEILHQQCTEKMPVQNIKDKNIRKIVKTATEKRQSDRYQTASEFRVAVDAVRRQMKPINVSKPATIAPSVTTVVENNGTSVGGTSVPGTVVPGTVVPSGTSVPGTSIPESQSSSFIPSSQEEPKKKSNTLLYIIAGIVVVAIAVGAALLFTGGNTDNEKEDEQQEETIGGVSETGSNDQNSASAVTTSSTADEPVSTTSTESSSTQQETTQPVAQPSETPAQKESSTPKEVKTNESAPSATKSVSKSESATEAKAEKSSGGMKLSYGKYTGSIKNGYPNGKGKLVYTTSRRINKYDSKGIVAQPGEYVEGLFVNGFLTVGKHYSASGELLNKISAGVAEGVYESK